MPCSRVMVPTRGAKVCQFHHCLPIDAGESLLNGFGIHFVTQSSFLGGMIITAIILMGTHQDRLGNIMAYGSSNLSCKFPWIHFRKLGQGHTIVAKLHLAGDWLVMMVTFAETLMQAVFQVIGSGQHLHALSQEIAIFRFL